MGILDKIKKISIKNKLLILGSFLVVVGLVLTLSKAFASPVPVKSVEITSEKLDYTKKDPGSFSIEKSAEWTSKGKARITFDIDTVVKAEDKYRDIIFVLDVSGSMDGDKINRVKQDSIDLINSLLSDPNNRASLITFETESQLVLPLTNDRDNLVNTINNLTTGNMTNYYQALVNVDNILKDYKKEENRECIVLFLTDGYPNVDTPNEEGQYSYLRKQYPYVTINGVQYEMGSDVLDPIKKVSDQQFIADMTNLNNILFEASVAPSTYNEFLITDYINDDYFEIDSVDSITSTVGTAKLEYEESTPKVIWDIGNIRSGASVKLTIDVNLKDEYINKGGLYPTNKKEEIKTEIDEAKENITSPKTPVLADNYRVIYDGNVPEGCTVENIPEITTRRVFDTVEISNQGAVCDGYQFKGWHVITENIKKINNNYFEMPESDVVIRATWSRMSVAKNMDGEVFKVQTLYKIVADQASLDNTKSKFVSSTSGIDFSKSPSDTNGKGVYTIASTKDYDYPVHYFRGKVTNNNVKFANFCWKIVRTTETGGVKLVYNGTPNEKGGCTTIDESIGRSVFNSKVTSLANVGYMYGKEYSINTYNQKKWYTYAGKSWKSKYTMGETEYYYGDSVTYDETNNTYTIVNPTKYLWSANYNKLKGKYTCFKDTEEGCETVSYIDDTYSETATYIGMSSGETYESVMEQARSVKWIYGNDVEYIDGKYVLKDTMEYAPVNFSTDYKTGFNAHRYTCFTTENSCASVNYLYYNDKYIILKEGKKIDDTLKEMLTESSNEKSSTVKTKIDTWYSKNMIEYAPYLEDTVWCNDRSIYKKYGLDKDSTTNGYITYGAYGRNKDSFNPNINCPNDNDKFTVSSEKGNGKLTYPIALLTADEITLAGEVVSYLYNSGYWWVLSPSDFEGRYSSANIFYVRHGYLANDYVYTGYAVVNASQEIKPSVSLAPGTMVRDGNGTSSRPYEVFLTETD